MALPSMPNFNFYFHYKGGMAIFVEQNRNAVLSFQQIQGCMEAIQKGIVSDNWSIGPTIMS